MSLDSIMTLQKRSIEDRIAEEKFEGQLCWDDAVSTPRPGILIAHTVRGRTDFEDDKGIALAEMGYAALTIDLYGVSSRGAEIGVLREHMNQHRADRPSLQQRLLGWLELLRSQPEVDAAKVAAIGFCFGGLCVLDLARSGVNLAAVASFHGILTPPGNTEGNRIKPKILVMHGWDDPLATPADVLALSEELTTMGADWQIHAYGNTLHAFTNPAANDQAAGTVYNANANRRSWAAMTDFFGEVFDA